MNKESLDKAQLVCMSNKEQTAKFCPMIRASCRIDCTCFIEAKYSQSENLIEAHCCSAALSDVVGLKGA